MTGALRIFVHVPIKSFLSVLLIGHEISTFTTQLIKGTMPTAHIIGSDYLSGLYIKTFEKYGYETTQINVEQATAHGIFRLAHQAGFTYKLL